MQITDVRGYDLKAELEEPFEWPDGNAYVRTAGVVRVETDEGLAGWGPAGYGCTQTVAQAKELLVGHSPLDTCRLNRLPAATRGPFDVALWDIVGKMLGEPIYRLLGGALRTRVLAYATGGYYRLPEDALDWLCDKVQQAVDRGFRAYKMKIGAQSLAYDLQRVDRVREVLGPDRRLAVDATTTYTRPLAMRVGRELEGRDILWFEDPLPGDDVDGYATLTEHLALPITAHYGAARGPLYDYIRRRAVDQVQPPITYGGYTLAQQMMGMTRLHRIVYKPSCWSTHLDIAATLHLLAVLPSSSTRLRDMPPPLEFDTSDNPLRDDSLLAEPIVLSPDGTVAVPGGPGLGVEVDLDKILKYAERVV